MKPSRGAANSMHGIIRWSTTDVPPAQRFDYFTEALSSALIPMRADSRERERMDANIAAAEFDGVTVIHQTGSTHWSYRDARDLALSGGHTFHLIANYSASWVMSHRAHIRLEPGDAVLTDSTIGHRLEMFQPYEVVHLKLSDAWLKRWLSRPAALVGMRIPAGARWSRALTAFMAQLSPDYMVGAPLPARVITDQLGALLALVAVEMGVPVEASGVAAALCARVKDHVHQCSADATLTADGIARTLDIPVDELHRCLAQFGETFGELLIRTRLDVATRMLQSKLFATLTAAEIAHRAGFGDQAKLERALRRRSTRTVAQLRVDAGCSPTDWQRLHS
jgi:AraC-like DNA-binding protein